MRAAPTGAARRLSPAGQLKNASSRHSLGLHIRKRCFGRWAIPHRYGRPVFQPQASFPRYSAPGEPCGGRASWHGIWPPSTGVRGTDWVRAKTLGPVARRLHDLLRVRKVSLRLVQRILQSYRGNQPPSTSSRRPLSRLRPCIPTSTDPCLATGRWSPISCSEQPFTA